MINTKFITLANGVSMPTVGFGTNDVKEVDTATQIIKKAIRLGYRHIDTAAQYGNEQFVGEAIQWGMDELGISRTDFFVTTKIANNDRKDYHTTLKCIDDSLNRLKVDYLDLYLIHWPVPWGREKDYRELNIETWQAMEQCYFEGKIRAIGVSNFLERHIEYLETDITIFPMVNQIEIHPQFQQDTLVTYCQNRNIVVQGWGPFKQGEVFRNEVLKKLAHKYKVSIAQLCIKWCWQREVVPLPKASTAERMKENLETPEFEISEEDMLLISGLDTDTDFFQNYSYTRQREY